MAAKSRISRFHQPLVTARFQPRHASNDSKPQEETTFQLVQDIMDGPDNRWNNFGEDTLTYVSSDGSSREKSKVCSDNVCSKPNRFFSRFEPKTPSTERKSRFEPVPTLPSQSVPQVGIEWTQGISTSDRLPEEKKAEVKPAPKVEIIPVKPVESEVKPEEPESKRRVVVASYDKPRVDPDLSQMLSKILASPWLQEEPYKSTIIRFLYALQDRPFPREWTPYFVNDFYVTSDSVAKFEGSEFIFQVGLAGTIPSGTSPLIYPFGAAPVDMVGVYPDQDITLIYAQPQNPTAQLKTRLMRHGFQYVLVPNVSHNFNDIQLPTTFTFRGQLKAR